MGTRVIVDNVGFSAGKYGPPNNLGRAYDKEYEVTASSRIWGLDEDGKSPKSYKVKVNVALLGRWVFLSVEECMHPLHALTNNINDPDRKMNPGEVWMYEYEWEKTDGVWKDEECDATPDRIYFKEMLPKEVLEAGGVASQHSIPIREYKYNFNDVNPDGTYDVTRGVTDTMGKLVIADTGKMEIWGNSMWEVDKTTSYTDASGKKQLKVENVIMKTNAFETHWPHIDFSKPGKQANDEDYYVGFHSFSLVFKLNAETYGDKLKRGAITEKEIPTEKTECKRVTTCGLDLDKLDDFHAEEAKLDPETGEVIDSPEMTAYRAKLKERRILAYIKKRVELYKKLYAGDDNEDTRIKILKKILEYYPELAKRYITSSDLQTSADNGGTSGNQDAGGMDTEE